MAVAGDFDTQTMLARIRELFEPIPAGMEPARLAREEPTQNGEVRLSVEGPGATSYVQVCYRFPSASHPDFFPLSVLDSLLAGPSNLNMFSGGISNKTRVSIARWWIRSWRSVYTAARRQRSTRSCTRSL